MVHTAPLPVHNQCVAGTKGVEVAIRARRRLFRDALATCLQRHPDFVLAGHAAELTDLVSLCFLRNPQLLLVDISGDDMSALEPLQCSRRRIRETRFVVVYEHLSPASVELAGRMGVDTLVPFSHGLEALLVVLCQHARVLQAGHSPQEPDERCLTDEEREIIALLASGHPVQRIADVLDLSPHDVENSKRRICTKLAVTSPSQVVARAVTLGLFDPPRAVTAEGSESNGGGTVGRDGRLPQLTAREADILGSIAMGHTVRQTARMFGIAAKTVENTQARLFLKLGAHSRAAAIAAAHGLGLLDMVCGSNSRRKPDLTCPPTPPRPAGRIRQETLSP